MRFLRLIGRIFLGFLMIGFIVWSVIAVRSRKVIQHSAFMLRAYAIGQGASTQTGSCVSLS